MIGCHAIAQDVELTVDKRELEEARWFTREEIADAMRSGRDGDAMQSGRDGDGAFAPPPPAAIAHTLLQWWLEK